LKYLIFLKGEVISDFPFLIMNYIYSHIFMSGLLMSGRPLFFRGERIQCPVFCISRSKGGRRASSKLTTKEGWLSAWNFAARLTTSLPGFFADHFFRSEKKGPPGHLSHNVRLFRLFNIGGGWLFS
jgi:hypothetical protein